MHTHAYTFVNLVYKGVGLVYEGISLVYDGINLVDEGLWPELLLQPQPLPAAAKRAVMP